MVVYDVTRDLTAGMAVWPGDTPYSLLRVAEIDHGDTVNVTQMSMSAHTGTHIDAPLHFAADGEPVERLDPALYWGPAQVVTVEKEEGPLEPADFRHIDLTRAPRLLIHSRASHLDPHRFPTRFVYPSPALAPYLAEKGIVLFGSDAPSMDHHQSKDLPGHQAMLKNRIAILEGLLLAAVPDGVYELVALPLKIVGGDGSPVRAVLRTLE